MARGIELPTRAVNGRLKLLSGDQYIDQLVAVALGDGDSDNPFQDLGLGEFMIFGINDSLTDGEINTRVQAAFELLETDQLAQLKSISFESRAEVKIMFLEYINLETGKRRELEVPLPEAA